MRTNTTVKRIARAPKGSAGRFQIDAVESSGAELTAFADMVLVVVGVRPDTALAAAAGAELGIAGAHQRGPEHAHQPRACLRRRRLRRHPPSPDGPHLPAAWDHGPQAGPGGRRERHRGEPRSSPAASAPRSSRSSTWRWLRTGLRDHEAVAAGFDPVTVEFEADDHKAYYPGSHRIRMRFTGDRTTGRLLGVQLFGHRHAEVAKRIDIAATAIFNEMTVEAMSDLDLSYTPPLGSPWDAVQMGAQAWVRAQGSSGEQSVLGRTPMRTGGALSAKGEAHERSRTHDTATESATQPRCQSIWIPSTTASSATRPSRRSCSRAMTRSPRGPPSPSG